MDKLDRGDKSLSKLIISPAGTPFPSGYEQFKTTTLPKVWVAIGKRLANATLTQLIIDLSDETNPQNIARWLNALSLGIKKNRSIEYMCFSHVHFRERYNDSFFVKIAPFWRMNKNIKNLELNSCVLDTISCHSFGYSISKCSHLKSISMNETHFTEMDFMALSPALCGSLRSLKITNGDLGGYEIELLSKSWMIDNTVPAVLDFSTNQIDSEGCRQLSGLLKVFKTVSLAHNDIGDYGIECFFGHHDWNPMNYSHIVSINLQDTNISDSACEVLKVVIGNEPFHLKELILDDNDISNVGFDLLLDGLTDDDDLEHLSIANNMKVDADGWKRLLNVLCDISTIEDTYYSNYTLEVCIPPHNHYNSSEKGKAIMKMCQINANAKKGRRKEKSVTSHLSGVNKVLLCHLITPYQQGSYSLSINDEEDDDKLMPYVLEWMSINENESNRLLVCNAFYIICRQNIHLFELADWTKRKREGLQSLSRTNEEYLDTLAAKAHAANLCHCAKRPKRRLYNIE